MARLPTPGGDNGSWGDILNDFLAQVHASDGTLKSNSVTSGAIAPNAVTNAAIASNAVDATSIVDGSITNALLADGTIQEAKLASAVQTKLNAAGGTPDWSTITNKPTVIAAGSDATAAKATLSLTKSDVGLGNVDNTSDATKNSAVVTLTNKTISGLSNTLTNIPASAISGLSTDYSKLVVTTAAGSPGAETGANTWAKIATFSTGTNQYAEAQLILSVTGNNSGNHDTAIVSVFLRANTTGSNPDVDVKILAKGGDGYYIVNDSFKVISGGWSTDMELWFKKAQTYGQFSFYETSKQVTSGTLTYSTNPSWQSAAPTGMVNNVSSDGVHVGLPLTVNGSISASSFSMNSIKDTYGNDAVIIDSSANAVNYIKLATGAAGGHVAINAGGADSDVGLTLATKGNGVFGLWADTQSSADIWVNSTQTNVDVNFHTAGSGKLKANNIEVVTLSDTQTLTNKTLTNPKINAIQDTNSTTLLDLVTIGSAVNHVYVTNQSAGNYPTIGVDGSDTDIGIAIAPKNNGPVNLFGNNPTIAAAGGYNGGNLNLNLKSQGTGVVQANSVPVQTSKMMYPFYMDPSRFEPWPQILCQGEWTLTGGDLPLTLFIPSVDMTVSNIWTMGWNDTSQSGATSCRVAIYQVNDVFDNSGNKMTCIARSAHKADRWNGSVVDIAPIVDDGAVSPNAISSVNLIAGQQYAVGYMSVGHTGTVKLTAMGAYRKGSLEPHVGYFGGGGYTDMPNKVGMGWIEEWTFIWFALT